MRLPRIRRKPPLPIRAEAVGRAEPTDVATVSGRHVGGHVPIGEARRIVITDAVLCDIEIRGEALDHLLVRGPVTFERCRFIGTIDGAYLSTPAQPQASYRDCLFDEVTFNQSVNAGQALFESCEFRDVRIQTWFPGLAEFIHCSFSGEIRSTRFFGRPFGPYANALVPPRTTNRFTGNSFRDAHLIDTSFSYGISLRDQELPESEPLLYIADLRAAVERASAGISQWGDGDRRRLGQAMIKTLRHHLESGQTDYLADQRSVHGTIPDDIADQVWELLTTSQ